MHPAILLLKKIPKGKVATYKEMARICKTSPRAIGRIMAGNRHPIEYPCYKVVASSGELTGYSAPGGIAEKRRLLKNDGVEFSGNRVEKKYFHRFARVFLLFLLLPILVHAQAGSSTQPAASSTLPSLVHEPVIGRTHDISFVGDVVEVKNDGTLVISPTPVGKIADASSSVGIIHINADTAQIIKTGRKNAPLAALVPGDYVQIKGKILPDGSYLGQHIKTIAKKAPAKTVIGKSAKAKASTKAVKQKIVPKSKKIVPQKKVQQKSKQIKKKIR